jgi:hypothetical protein
MGGLYQIAGSKASKERGVSGMLNKVRGTGKVLMSRKQQEEDVKPDGGSQFSKFSLTDRCIAQLAVCLPPQRTVMLTELATEERKWCELASPCARKCGKRGANCCEFLGESYRDTVRRMRTGADSFSRPEVF